MFLLLIYFVLVIVFTVGDAKKGIKNPRPYEAMRCPTCGGSARRYSSGWECPWCGDSGL